jgi:hypothetical protein
MGSGRGLQYEHEFTVEGAKLEEGQLLSAVTATVWNATNSRHHRGCFGRF